jgi:hypothetical protein
VSARVEGVERAPIAWRMTRLGAVTHAVHTDGTNRAISPALCGVSPDDGRWRYTRGRSWGFNQNKCLRCCQIALRPFLKELEDPRWLEEA